MQPQPQQPITKQTQLASYQELQATLPSKQSVVLTILNLEGRLTARAIAEKMYALGFATTKERNNSQPRLNELVKAGKVAVVGKAYDKVTNRNVALYEIKC